MSGTPPARGKATFEGKRGRPGGTTSPPRIRVHSRRSRVDRLRAAIHAEALIFRSESRWLLAAVAWITLIVAALLRHWDLDSFYHFALAVLAMAAWFAAFHHRPRVRSILSTLLVLAAVSIPALEGSQYLAGGLALPGLGLLTMTSLRM